MPEALAATLEKTAGSAVCQVIGGRSALGDAMARHLGGVRATRLEDCRPDVPAIYIAPPRRLRDDRPNLEDARRWLANCRTASVKHVLVVSSTSVYCPSHHHPGMISEDRLSAVEPRNEFSRAWLELEAIAAVAITQPAKLTIVRASPTLTPGGTDYFSSLLRSRLAVTFAGFDPTLQFITAASLADVIGELSRKGVEGTFNAAPSAPISLQRALHCSRTTRIPLPATIMHAARRVLSSLGLAHTPDQAQHIRFHWTAANDKLRAAAEVNLPPSAQAIAEFNLLEGRRNARQPQAESDTFGMDKEYIARYGHTLFRFMHDVYWRIEERGLENIPTNGRAVLAGIHRGFMPFDGVMTLHPAATRRGRYPRFLIHPSLLKFPYLFDFMTKLGGIMACQENAKQILERDGIVAVFPEGIRGAFTLYRDAYRLGKFGRDEFVRMALRHGAPIVPFVTVGSAEIFPILRRVEWGWCKRVTEWPYLPITPTFPIVPVPLPSKWHTAYLEPLHVEREYGPEAADDPAVVRAISREVRNRMQQAIEDMRSRRRHIFFGSLEGGI